MAAAQVGNVYTNGTAMNSAPGDLEADGLRTEQFYEKLLELYNVAVAGKHPRLKFSKPVSNNGEARTTIPSTASAVTHNNQTGSSMPLPGLNNQAAKSKPTPAAAPAVAKSTPITTQPKINPILLQKSGALLDAEEQIRVRKARERFEKLIAAHANDDEPIVRGTIEVPLNLLPLAQARVPPVSGLRDETPDSGDMDSYYSSKANSWSTDHPADEAVVISDDEDDEPYEPPQVDVTASKAAQTSLSDGEWEPEWDDDYEPPTTAAFGGHEATHDHSDLSGKMQQNRSQQMQPPQLPNTIALNQISVPVAPQPSRISPLATGNLTHTMQSQVNSLQQPQNQPRPSATTSHNDTRQPAGQEAGMTVKQLRKVKRLQRKAQQKDIEQRAAPASLVSSTDGKKKRKREDRLEDKSGKRRAVATPQHASSDPYIKLEPGSPPRGLAAIPTRQPSVVQYNQPQQSSLSSPYRPRSSYVSDSDHSPRSYRYAETDADRMAMPPPTARRERDNHNLRRVASLQNARRPASPSRDYVAYADPRAPPPQYDYADRPSSRASVYREPAMRPASPPRASTAFGMRSAPVRLGPPPVGSIVEDEFGNKYIAELVPDDDYPPPPRQAYPPEYAAQTPAMQPAAPAGYAQSNRQAYPRDEYAPAMQSEPEPNQAYMPPLPSRARAYSHAPELAPTDHQRARAYSHFAEAAPEPRQQYRAYSVHPQEAPSYSNENVNVHRQRAYYSKDAAANRAYEDRLEPQLQPPPRAYSTRPSEIVPQQAPPPNYVRAGSMMPPSYAPQRAMAPPAMPVVRSREYVPAEDVPAQYAMNSAPVRRYRDERGHDFQYQ